MNRINFVAQTARKRPIKPMPAKYQESPIRPNIEISDGIRPHFPMVPLRYLDVKFQDKSTEQYVVIPKGRIISAVTTQNAITVGGALSVSRRVISNETLGTASDNAHTDVLMHTVTTEENTTKEFTFTLTALPVKADSVSVNDGTETFTDDAEGVLTGGAGGSGTVNYETGEVTVTFNAAPGEGAEIDASWTDLDETFTGNTAQTPIIAGTFKVADDTETFSDDGEGVLTGDNGGSGTIVYSTGAYSIVFGAGVADGDTVVANYEITPDNKIYTGTTNQVDGTSPLYIDGDGSYYGVSRDISALMVPANGGTNRTITYDALDVLAAVPSAAGSKAVVEADDTFTLPANAPVGVAMYDIYQDIRGAHLNYELWKSYGVLAEQFIKLPFVDFGLLRSIDSSLKFVNDGAGKSGYKTGAASVSAVEDAGYLAAEAKYSFLYFDSLEASTAGLAGQLLMPDLFGNWIPQAAAAANSSSIALTAARNGQTVGRLLYVDTRFPKDLLETVQTPYMERIAGAGTQGLTENLLDFINIILVASGYTYGTTDYAIIAREMVQAGAFGYAQIQLSAR